MLCRMSKRIQKRKFDNVFKVKFILVLLVIAVAVTFSIPSLARYKNFVNLEAMFNKTEVWDGTIATSFSKGTGSQEDPYIIMTASELAFFGQEMSNPTYAGAYFELGNNIILNKGTFGYEDNNVTYSINDTKFYLGEYTGNAYESSSKDGNIISTINVFDSIDSFNGYFNGNNYTIYGLYITEDTTDLAFINSLKGTFENVYFKNTMIYGGANSAILANDVYSSEVNNVSTEGIVVGTGSKYDNNISFGLGNLEIVKDVTSYRETYDLTEYASYDFDSLVISGTYSSTLDNQVLSINGHDVSVGEFEVDLGTDVTELVLEVNDEEVSDIYLYDVVLIGTYNYPLTSGFVGKTANSNFTNVMNKADVYGINTSGLFGMVSDISLNNAYNHGNLSGINASAIVGRVTDNGSTIIDKVYNNGVLNGTNTYFIGDMVSNSEFKVGNSFNTQVLSSTFGNVSGNVEVINLYDVNSTNVIQGSLSGTVNVVERNEINKELLVDSLGFYEYVDDIHLVNNPLYVWVYGYEEVPILYLDELNNPIASLNIEVYSWNDIGYDLNEIKFTNSKAFNITPLNGFTEFKEVYYYIYDGDKALSREEVAAIVDADLEQNIDGWQVYEDIVQLDVEGRHIVYIKILDQSGNVTYINSDVLFFDLYGPDIKLSLDNSTWDSFNTSLDSKYISDTVDLSLEVSDEYSDVDEVSYYVSEVLMSKDDLSIVDTWISYEDVITLDNKGTSVVYIKASDTNGHENIINSDYIIYGGYSSKLYVGTDTAKEVNAANITKMSSVTYKYSYDEDIIYTEGYSNKIVVSNSLPIDTVMTFIDHKLNKVYSYKVIENATEYNLKDFVQVGNVSGVKFEDMAYTVTNTKDVSLVIDFSNTTISDDFTFKAYIDLRDSLDNVVLSTLKDGIGEVKVFKEFNNDIKITNNSVIYGINYDSNSTNVVNFEYSINSNIVGNILVSDTSYEGMKTGIAIKLVDSEGNIIDKKYLKNMEFIVDNKNYSADNDGVVRINMSDNLDKVSGSVTVITHENDLDLTDGSYSLVIVPYVANDGKYTNVYSNSIISIPVASDYQEILDYEFNVLVDDSYKILNKSDESVIVPFRIINDNSFSDSSVRVSLYKKDSLTAYNQDYSIVDLDNFITNELTLVTNYAYLVDSKSFELNLDLTKFEKTGYEIRFELFDGDKRIDVIKKKFIIK